MCGRGNVPSFHPPSEKILDPITGALKVAAELLVVSAAVAICEKMATVAFLYAL
jgi:hypothetical protein